MTTVDTAEPWIVTRLRDCAERGLTRTETAKEVGYSVTRVDQWTAQYGVKLADGRRRYAKPAETIVEPVGLSAANAVKRVLFDLGTWVDSGADIVAGLRAAGYEIVPRERS